MKEKYRIPVLGGLIYGCILILMSRFFFAYVGNIVGKISRLVGMDEITANQIGEALGQLKDASVKSPYLIVFLAGILIAGFFSIFIRRCKRKKLVTIIVSVLMALPLTLTVLFFTEINGICPASAVFKATEKVEERIVSYESSGDSWYAGFGRRQFIPDEKSGQPLYIAGYNNGVEIADVLDYCEARALWLDTGDKGILLIGIDCIALDSSVVNKIRASLADIPDCVSIQVYSTHTHAGADTLGMWGPIGIDGKNEAYMENLIQSAVEAGKEAVENRTKGELYFAQIKTENMYRDSRNPQVYDENLYQLHFKAEDKTSGIRLFSYGAHPESLRGNNRLLSRDFAGRLCDEVAKETGDDTMFAPGAIGGLIMTKEFVYANYNPVENLKLTSEALAEYALSITGDMENKIDPQMTFNSKNCVVPMDNTAFWIYKLLGILNNKEVRAESATGYGVETEVSVLKLDNLAIALIPGEIFPELVYGGEYGDAGIGEENPESLVQIAEEYGIEDLVIVGLANDEIGYIVPPTDFLVNEKLPYLERTMDDKGEDHYEETNSIGIECANVIAETFEENLILMDKN